jgi:hypothetical protein
MTRETDMIVWQLNLSYVLCQSVKASLMLEHKSWELFYIRLRTCDEYALFVYYSLSVWVAGMLHKPVSHLQTTETQATY